MAWVLSLRHQAAQCASHKSSKLDRAGQGRLLSLRPRVSHVKTTSVNLHMHCGQCGPIRGDQDSSDSAAPCLLRRAQLRYGQSQQNASSAADNSALALRWEVSPLGPRARERASLGRGGGSERVVQDTRRRSAPLRREGEAEKHSKRCCQLSFIPKNTVLVEKLRSTNIWILKIAVITSGSSTVREHKMITHLEDLT